MNPGTGIAGVATLGYGGFLIGPPLIGTLAELIGLDRALLLIVVFCTLIAFFAGRQSNTEFQAASSRIAPGGMNVLSHEPYRRGGGFCCTHFPAGAVRDWRSWTVCLTLYRFSQQAGMSYWQMLLLCR